MQSRPTSSRIHAGISRRVVGVLALVTAVVLASALLGVGCAEGNDTARRESRSPTTTLVAFSRWSSRVEAGCSAANEQFARVRGAAPATTAEAVVRAQDIDQYASAILAAVEQVGTPAGKTDQAEAFESQLQRLADQTRRMASAARSADVEALQGAITDVASTGTAINPLATQLHVPACGGF